MRNKANIQIRYAHAHPDRIRGEISDATGIKIWFIDPDRKWRKRSLKEMLVEASLEWDIVFLVKSYFASRTGGSHLVAKAVRHLLWDIDPVGNKWKLVLPKPTEVQKNRIGIRGGKIIAKNIDKCTPDLIGIPFREMGYSEIKLNRIDRRLGTCLVQATKAGYGDRWDLLFYDYELEFVMSNAGHIIEQ